jgi:hypothetical protein
MKKILFIAILMLSVFIIAYSYVQAEKIEICAAKSGQPRSSSSEVPNTLPVAKPVIKKVDIEDVGAHLSWLITIENKGGAPTTGADTVEIYRNPDSGNPPELMSASTGVPIIAAGETKVASITLNPDPKIGNYTLKLVNKGKVIHARPYGLGIPTMEVGEVKVGNDKLNWEAVIKNTWIYTLGDIKVQAFKKAASQKKWEDLGESHIDFLRGRTSATINGKGGSTGADEFKVAVFLRRIKSEPYVEMASKTLTLKK